MVLIYWIFFNPDEDEGCERAWGYILDMSISEYIEVINIQCLTDHHSYEVGLIIVLF